MNRRYAWAALLATALTGTRASADSLTPTLSQPLREVSHSVDVRIVDGIARYTVRRTFANPGDRADEASVSIDLPPGAAATGLRIRARDRWYKGELLEAELAREKYHELTSLGAFEPKDPALLQWVWADRLHLQVFPVFPKGANTVEYTLTAPVRYRGGRYVLTYPRPTDTTAAGEAPLATPVIRVHPGYGDASMAILVDGKQTVLDAPVVLAPPKPPVWHGDGAPDSGASYIHSLIALKGSHTARAARVSLEIDHTYRGDLELELVTPTGTRLPVAEGSGSDNDIRGTYTVDLPKDTPQAGNWYLCVADTAGLDVGALDRWSIELDVSPADASTSKWTRSAAAKDVPMFIPDAPDGDGDGGLAVIELDPPKIRTFAARVGRVVASQDTSFLRVEVDAAPELRPLPKRASVVFVVDASISVGPEGVARQMDLARAYATHVPDASIEVVAFRRHAQRVFGDFRPANKLGQALASPLTHKRLVTGNGSALDEGLALAAQALDGRTGPKRIVVASDALLRSRFTQKIGLDAASKAPRGTITHLVIPEGGDEFAMQRDDKDPLAKIPGSRGGVLYRIEIVDDMPAKDLAAGVLGLVRPVALENFEVASGAKDFEVPDVLHEGEQFRGMVSRTDVPRQVVVRAMLWGTQVERTIRASRPFSRSTAAFVFSEDEHTDLTDGEMMTVAMFGRAVSPVTSYLATEPGVRPSTIGLGELGLVGTGSGGGGSAASSFGYGGMGAARKYTLRELVDARYQRCINTHKPASGWSLGLQVEATYQEIVDVIPERPATTPLDRCIVEGVWHTRLTWNFNNQRKTHALAFKYPNL